MRKFVIYSVVIATLVWTLGLGAIVPVSAAYTPSAGDYIKTASHPAVYYIGAEGQRILFSNLVTFRSWDSTSWSDLVDSGALQIISQPDFDDLEVGDHVTVRPGVNLISFDNSAKTYAVSPGAVLSEITDTAAAVALYGADWSDSVVEIQNAFETDYTTTGADLTADSNLPDGSLVKYEGSEDIYYIEDGMKRAVTDDAFVANSFSDSSVRTIATSMTYDAGESITGEEAAIANADGSAVTNGGAVTGDVTVRLSSMTATPTTYLSTQALAEFLTVEVTNGNSTDIEIDSFKIERGGLAGDTPFNSIAAYEDSVLGNQIGLNKTLNSSHQSTFGDNVTVAAGTTKKVVIVANFGTAVASDAARLGLVSMALKGGGTVNGLDSTIWGNVMGQTGSVSIATVTVAAGSNNPAAADIKIGDTNVDIAEIKITNDSSTELVQVEKVVFKQAGTIADSDVEQYQLINSEDSAVLATAPQVDKYITFVLDTPLEIGKAKNKSLMVQAVEINDGSSRHIDLDIQRETDILVKDLTYNAYIRIDDASKWPNTTAPLFNASADQTIGNGTVRVEASNDFSAANIAEGQTVQIAEWLFTVKGEEVDITQIATKITTSTSAAATESADITNGIFFLVDTDVALTGATDAAANVGGTPGITSTDTITLGIGVHKIGLKVDLSSDFSNDDTLKAGLTAANMTVTGNTTGNSITPTPAAEVQSSTQTIKTAKLTISASINPAAQNVIRGDNVVAANIILDAAASGDDLTMTQLKTDVYTTTMSPDELTSLTLWDGATEILTTNDPVPTSSTADDTVTTTWSFASPLSIAKGTVKTLQVKVTTAGSTSASDVFSIGAPVTATAGATVKDSEGEEVTPTYTSSEGQDMTIQTTGTLTITRSDEYANAFLVGNSDGLAVGKFTATAQNGAVEIEKMYVTVAAVNSGGTDEIEALYLYDGSTLIATATLTGSDQAAVLFNMEGDPYIVEVNTTNELTIKVDTGVIANDGTATNATANAGLTLSIASGDVTAKTNGTDSTVTSATLTFPSYRIVKSTPTVVIASTGGSVTANGEYDLIDVTVTADAKGPIGLYKMTFKVTTTTVVASDYQVYEGGTLVASESATATHGINRSYINDVYQLVEVYFNLAGSLGGRLRQVAAGSSKTYTLKASFTSFDASASNGVSTSMTGDDTAATYVNAVSTDALDDDDFIWSDLSYGNTSTTATTTLQWLNGTSVDSSGGLVGTTSSAKSI
jgi:hypothetical protein